jgi:preprotein translocase SecE subunit
MYKWPQGRVIRTICLILSALVASDLGYNGAYGQLSVYYTPDGALKQLALGIFFSVLAGAAVIAGLVTAGFHHRAVDFLIEVEQEMVKVEWPKGNALVRSTLVVALGVAILAFIILGVDAVNFYLLSVIQSLGGKT